MTIKSLIDLYEAYSKYVGVSNETVNQVTFLLTLLSVAFLLIGMLFKFFGKILKIRNSYFLNKNLSPYFTPNDVAKATKFFVQSKYQTISSTEFDEPETQLLLTPRKNLISLIIDIIDGHKNNDLNYILILADSGMGKTTFMINLYLTYKNKYIWPWYSKKKDIVLLPLGAPQCMDIISSIKGKENTVLLLDAFDEDILAIIDYKKRLEEIIARTYEFYKVVFTCRTQFFPTEIEEPNSTGVFSYGEDGERKFHKFYLSVFDNSDIKKYLRKKYSFLNLLNIKKRHKAQKIIRKSPNLFIRPILLNYIDDLINSNSKIHNSFDIYKQLVEKWIIRESKKPDIVRRYQSKDKYQSDIYKFSIEFAKDLYSNRHIRGGYYFSLDSDTNHGKSERHLDLTKFNLLNIDIRNKSLLNRTADGKIKFSHKSIMEFFLAVDLLVNSDFFIHFDFTGMTATRQFIIENILDEYGLEENLEYQEISCYLFSEDKTTITINYKFSNFKLLKLFYKYDVRILANNIEYFGSFLVFSTLIFLFELKLQKGLLYISGINFNIMHECRFGFFRRDKHIFIELFSHYLDVFEKNSYNNIKHLIDIHISKILNEIDFEIINDSIVDLLSIKFSKFLNRRIHLCFEDNFEKYNAIIGDCLYLHESKNLKCINLIDDTMYEFIKQKTATNKNF